MNHSTRSSFLRIGGFFAAFVFLSTLVHAETLWKRRTPGPLGSYDYVNGLALDAAGNVFVTGDSPNNGASDYLTVKYAAGNGAKLWSRRFNGPSFSNDVAVAVVTDSVGNAIVSGWSAGTNTGADYYTVKYAGGSGQILWAVRFDQFRQNDFATAMAIDGQGNPIVTGYSSVGPSYDFCTVKYNGATGKRIWVAKSGGPALSGDEPADIAVDAAGNVFVTGYSVNGKGDSDYLTVKYAASNGATLWSRRYGSPSNLGDEPVAIAIDKDGNAIVTGITRVSTAMDYYTIKYAAADGKTLWGRKYDGPVQGDDEARDVITLPASGDVIVTGYSNASGTGEDYYTAKYSAATGAILWQKRYTGPVKTTGQDRATALALDPAGDVVVTGFSGNTEIPLHPVLAPDYFTIKYSAATGAPLWSERTDGFQKADIPVAVKVSGNGEVVVSGSSFNADPSPTPAPNPDYLTVRYKPVP